MKGTLCDERERRAWSANQGSFHERQGKWDSGGTLELLVSEFYFYELFQGLSAD